MNFTKSHTCQKLQPQVSTARNLAIVKFIHTIVCVCKTYSARKS